MNLYFRAGLNDPDDKVSPCNHEGDHLEPDNIDQTVWCKTCRAWFIQPVPHTEMPK